MASITTIDSGDLISDSRTDINTNFENLNDDKIETSFLDTDNTLGGGSASDVKIPSQKAVKTYLDTFSTPNASITAKGAVEEATDAQIAAGTDTGETGARLFAVPSKIAKTATTQTFNYTGAGQTWTKPTGCKAILVELWGGGGSGKATNNNDKAAGGGGGGYVKFYLPASVLASTESVTIGAGGAAVSGATNGNAGGNTTFGTTTTLGTATGGAGGTNADATAGGTGTETLLNPSAEVGGAGDDSTGVGGSVIWAGAGGGGIDGTGGTPITAGGTSVFGGAGGTGAATTGVAGSVPGGGGGGVDGGTSGAGGNGRARITEFY